MLRFAVPKTYTSSLAAVQKPLRQRKFRADKRARPRRRTDGMVGTACSMLRTRQPYSRLIRDAILASPLGPHRHAKFTAFATA